MRRILTLLAATTLGLSALVSPAVASTGGPVVFAVENVVDLSGLFVYVGLEPNSQLVKGLVKLDNAGHIPVNLSMETEVRGLYAAGDIRQHSASQLVTSAGDGATAAIAAFNYINSQAW